MKHRGNFNDILVFLLSRNNPTILWDTAETTQMSHTVTLSVGKNVGIVPLFWVSVTYTVLLSETLTEALDVYRSMAKNTPRNAPFTPVSAQFG